MWRPLCCRDWAEVAKGWSCGWTPGAVHKLWIRSLGSPLKLVTIVFVFYVSGSISQVQTTVRDVNLSFDAWRLLPAVSKLQCDDNRAQHSPLLKHTNITPYTDARFDLTGISIKPCWLKTLLMSFHKTFLGIVNQTAGMSSRPRVREFEGIAGQKARCMPGIIVRSPRSNSLRTRRRNKPLSY